MLGRVDLHDKQKHICIYSILILHIGFLWTNTCYFAYLKCVIPRWSSSPHQLKRYANAFSSPEY